VPCLFNHSTNGVTFVQVVDDLGVKYKLEKGRDQFLQALRLMYKITFDAQGAQYLGMAITHDKQAVTMSISMSDYARAVNPTMLTTTYTIASKQSSPTQAVKAEAGRLLQYAVAHPNHMITFKKSKMHIIIQADASKHHICPGPRLGL
jgi:hypothetical protein